MLDPQLHTHAVVANMVRNNDGSTTALHNDLIFRTQKLGSEIYRNDLAREVRGLGYTVERSGKDQLIEIKEVPRDLVDQFSKRRAEIEAALSDRGIEASAKTAELAALATRAAKHNDVDRGELLSVWQKEAAALGLTPEKMRAQIEETKDKARFHLPGVTREGMAAPAPADAVASLRQAIQHISEHSVHYSEKDILTSALGFARSAGLPQIQAALTEAKDEGFILTAKTKDGDRLTDSNTLQAERTMAKLYRMGQKVGPPSLTPYNTSERVNLRPHIALAQRLERTTLTDGQKDAVRTALTGAGRVVGVQGYAGTGKTFALAHLVKEAERAGYIVEGLAPSTQATRQLADAVPASETLQARLLRSRSPDKETDPRKTILVVDEASMVSNRQMVALLHQAEEQKIVRVVLVGDVQQLDGVAAGTPFALLQNIGMRTAVMDDIQRQRNDGARAIVQHAIAGDVQKAFAQIGDNVQEARNVAKATATAWLALDKAERAETGVVTPTNKSRADITTHIREGLRTEGQLTGPEQTQDTLTPLRMTRAQVSDPRSYREGDLILPHQSVASAGISRGHLYEVVSKDADHIMIRDRAGGDPLPFAPDQNSKLAGSVEVFEPATKDIAVGDEVKFRISDKESGVANGDTARIEQIDQDQIWLHQEDGTVTGIDRTSLAAQGIDHAYALTAHDFQGATVDNIMVAMSASETMADQKSFYVAVSRARDDISLVTDDAERLAERLQEQTGQKISALEAWVDAERDRATIRDDHDERDTKAERDDAERPEQDRDTDDTNKTIETETRELYRQDREAVAQLINTERGDFER